MRDEIWKPIEHFEDRYEVSSLGRVRSLPHVVEQKNRWRNIAVRYQGRILVQHCPDGHYPTVTLSKGKLKAQRTVHSLVAEAFIGARPDGKMVCHKDGGRSDCSEANLYYGTALQNAEDAAKHGATARGERQGAAKLTEAAVIEIRKTAHLVPYQVLADKFGVGRSAVGMVARGVSWRHVDQKEEKAG